jgi:hypothetical protein
MGRMRDAYSSSVGRTEGKRLLGRKGLRREDNIIMDVMETWWEGVNWMHVA